jgi:hypothetical protein
MANDTLEKRNMKWIEGEYFYTLYKLDYNFFTYVLYRASSTITLSAGNLYQTVDKVEDEIMRNPYLYKYPIDRGSAPQYRKETNRRARETILAWMGCSKRLRMVKDVAQLIGKMCWKDRCLWME